MSWNDKDETCDHCGQVTQVARGLNKQNLKRLFFSKPDMRDFIILLMLSMVLLMAWRYGVEVSSCQEVITNIEGICSSYSIQMGEGLTENNPEIQFNWTDALKNVQPEEE